jgi:hypothetical protein
VTLEDAEKDIVDLVPVDRLHNPRGECKEGKIRWKSHFVAVVAVVVGEGDVREEVRRAAAPADEVWATFRHKSSMAAAAAADP